MLLEPLVSTIETIKARITTHGHSLRENETRTRTALIDTLLTALRWDVSDPALVTPEYRTGGWADYALIGPGNKPAAIIEAKRLGSVVENHLEQAVGYCIQEGIAYAGVTDGNHWQLYRTFEPVPLVEKLVLDVNLYNSPAHESALKLLLLWRPNLASGQPVIANPSIVDITAAVASGSAIWDADASDSLLTSIPPNDASIDWIPLSGIENVTGKRAPVEIRFSGGETRPLRAWWQVLVESAEFLVRRGTLTTDHLPNDNARGLRFINSAQQSPNGRNYITPKTISNGITLETHLSSKAIISYSKRLLTHFGTSLETVELRFE